MKFKIASMIAMLTLSMTAFAAHHGTGHAKGKDIVDTAVSAGSFETLVAAAKAAGLVDALKGEGSLTVFAPTDEAFAKLPEGTVASLLKPENIDQLKAILTYHVVPGKMDAKAVMGAKTAETLNGQRIAFSTKDDKVMVGGATVVKADIACSNGVIHVIDSVILPSSKNIVETAAGAGSFSTLIAAAKAAGLAEALQGEGPFTVFAPTDEAFAALPAGTVASLLLPQNKEKLATILKYHVISGRVYSDGAIKAGSAPTLQGSPVTIKADGGSVTVDKASVVKADIDTSNGVIHVIDKVIMP